MREHYIYRVAKSSKRTLCPKRCVASKVWSHPMPKRRSLNLIGHCIAIQSITCINFGAYMHITRTRIIVSLIYYNA